MSNPLRGKDPIWEPFGPGFQKEDSTGTRHPRRLDATNVSTSDSTGVAKKAHALIINSAGQVIPTATLTTVTFDTLIEDNVGLWKSGTPTKFTIPNFGYPVKSHWLLHAHVTWDGSAAGTTRQLFLLQNGATNFAANIIPNPPNATVKVTNDCWQVIHEPNPGDNFTIQVFQDTGGNLSIGGALVGTVFFEIINIW